MAIWAVDQAALTGKVPSSWPRTTKLLFRYMRYTLIKVMVYMAFEGLRHAAWLLHYHSMHTQLPTCTQRAWLTDHPMHTCSSAEAGVCATDVQLWTRSLAMHSSQQVLVLESCQGLVTAAVAERLGGYGSVCAAHMTTGGYAPLDAAKLMNFTPQQMSIVCVSSLYHLHRAQVRDAVPCIGETSS